MNTRDPGAVVLHCRRCGALITAENINLATLLAKCRHCHAVFGFTDQLSGAGASAETRTKPKPKPPPLDMPLPEGLSLSERGDTLRLVRRWYGLSLLFPLLVCIVLNTGLVFGYVNLAAEPGADLELLLLLLLPGVASVALTYAILAGMLNRTIIEASTTHLAIRHAPLPWPGKRKVRVKELRQLFCEEQVTDGPGATYSLNAVLRNGRRLTLVKGLFEAKQALFLEHALERRLGIVNRPVVGELRR